MKGNEFEARMRAREYYHTLRLLPGTWAVLRVDGRGFSRLTHERFEKPFDTRMSEFMVIAARALLEEFQGVYAYTQSDEISVLFAPSWSLFDRELEKLVSLGASTASAAFSLAHGERAIFDGRVWLGTTEQDVMDYFRWRQSDAARCALNAWAYWTLRHEGASAAEATEVLRGATVASKNELLFTRGLNFSAVPVWQRRGVGLFWETYETEGFNPVAGRMEGATRRRIHIERDLPMKDEYAALVRTVMTSAHQGD